ncbi:MAG: globin family protein [Pseudomonadota bacterium]
MTPQTIALVQTSFAKVAPIADLAADIFYDKLFAIAPEVRPLFPEDMVEQKKKLMQMLALAVQNLDRFEEIKSAVADLGARHVGYGVEDAHYDAVGEALLGTLEAGLGPSWSPELYAAWAETYTILATVMKHAAAEERLAS